MGLFYICPTRGQAGIARTLFQSARIAFVNTIHSGWKNKVRRDRAQRKPMLLLMLSGVLLFRFAERALLLLLFHEPPRSTRSGIPTQTGFAA